MRGKLLNSANHPFFNKLRPPGTNISRTGVFARCQLCGWEEAAAEIHVQLMGEEAAAENLSISACATPSASA